MAKRLAISIVALALPDGGMRIQCDAPVDSGQCPASWILAAPVTTAAETTNGRILTSIIRHVGMH